MRRAVLHIMVLLLPAVIISCSEIYYPEVAPVEDMLIVDGLITDMQGMNVIKLRQSPSPEQFYLHPLEVVLPPVTDAVVRVEDDLGNIYGFRESRWGNYYPEPGFAGIEGRSYTLHIETVEGVIYESDPQTIVPAAIIKNVYARETSRDFLLRDFYGKHAVQTVDGLEILTGMSSSDDNILRFRIKPTLLLLYNYYEWRIPDIDVYYRWRKISIPDAEPVNLHRFTGGFGEITNHSLCFLPSSKSYYQLGLNEYVYRKILIIRYYTLNHESYRFHTEAEKQIKSENRLFDPVVSQLPTNLRSTSHPEKQVAGFFEASSTRSETHLLTERAQDDMLGFTRIEDLENVPDQGSMLNEKPYFWQD